MKRFLFVLFLAILLVPNENGGWQSWAFALVALGGLVVVGRMIDEERKG